MVQGKCDTCWIPLLAAGGADYKPKTGKYAK